MTIYIWSVHSVCHGVWCSIFDWIYGTVCGVLKKYQFHDNRKRKTTDLTRANHHLIHQTVCTIHCSIRCLVQTRHSHWFWPKGLLFDSFVDCTNKNAIQCLKISDKQLFMKYGSILFFIIFIYWLMKSFRFDMMLKFLIYTSFSTPWSTI